MHPVTNQTTNPESLNLEVPPNVRRANWRLLVAMAVFAVALGVSCFLWMYGRMAGQREAERAAGAMPAQTSEAAPANPSASPVAPR